MRRFLLVAVMCGAVTGAQAADMSDLPFLRGSFTEGLNTSQVNWQGFYVGGQAGYGSSDENLPAPMRPCLPPCWTMTSSRRCRFRNEISVSEGNSTRSSAFGAFAGYNSSMGRRRRRPGSNLHARQVRGSVSRDHVQLVSGSALSDSFFHDVAVNSSASISISDMATFRARAAYAWGCFLPYMFGGFALGKADISTLGYRP